MTEPHDPSTLPADLPRPEDDGGCDHLISRPLHAIALPSTGGGTLDLATRPGRTVIYCFPRAGRPDLPLPEGWNDIPGARGCTPQSMAFRDQYDDIRALHADVVGISTQTADEQKEIAERLNLPFPLLSDVDRRFAESLNLPSFEVEGSVLIKRLTLIVTEGIIDQVFYPVFPPDKAAEEAIVWLLAHPRRPNA
ncbi:MAG: peroxiredoxin [Alphaproteobacteria bacterium]|nr:peroxiredoxin [Alphaproteobacteria bacterium]